jgi:hypothetical protein
LAKLVSPPGSFLNIRTKHIYVKHEMESVIKKAKTEDMDWPRGPAKIGKIDNGCKTDSVAFPLDSQEIGPSHHLYLLRVRCFDFEFTAETQRTQRKRRGWLLAALRAPSAISASLR